MQNRPIISITIGPRRNEDRDHLRQTLNDIAQQNPLLKITEASEGHFILSGTNESHLEEACDLIFFHHKLDVEVSDPGVIYLETIRTDAEAESKYIRQTGGMGNYAHMKIRLEPQERGSGIQFADEIRNCAIPRKYISAIQEGIEEARMGGVLGGYETVDFRVILYDGSYHDTDSNETAFKIAASTAFKQATLNANPVMLEPMMALEIIAPQNLTDTIVHDLKRRRGKIQSAERALIRAVTPLAEILGYARDLESSTNGLAKCSIRFSHYTELSDGELPGKDGAGVTVKKPKGPSPKRGSTAADLDSE